MSLRMRKDEKQNLEIIHSKKQMQSRMPLANWLGRVNLSDDNRVMYYLLWE